MKATPNLTDQHRRDRLEFARLHMSWTHEWESVIFSDEKSSISIVLMTLVLLEGFTQEPRFFSKRNFGGGDMSLFPCSLKNAYLRRIVTLPKKPIRNVMGIETSCDDTAVSIRISLTVGGIHPESSARQHRAHIDRLVEECVIESGLRLSDLDAVAVSSRPGLVICLKVGIDKALALSRDYRLKLIPIHHMRAHAIVCRLLREDIEFPFISLLISGGHALIVVVRSVDNFEVMGIFIWLAWRNFGQTGRVLKLQPSGSHYAVALEQMAKSIQFAVMSHLCKKLDLAFRFLMNAETDDWDRLKRNDQKWLVVAGGVASNLYFMECIAKVASNYGFRTFSPPPYLCTDNAEMVAWLGIETLISGRDLTDSDYALPDNYFVTARSAIGSSLRDQWPRKKCPIHSKEHQVAQVEKEPTDVQKFEFVELVENHPALWDPKNTGYKKKSVENSMSLAEDFKQACIETNWTLTGPRSTAKKRLLHQRAKNKVKSASGAGAEDASSKWILWPPSAEAGIPGAEELEGIGRMPYVVLADGGFVSGST
uniref:N(6)-L-threonylcarbamoyladenine synthase n=1 Tax=Ditylenchus dipsaci TaxID=166011 RepID=A0A915DB00_9BILA